MFEKSCVQEVLLIWALGYTPSELDDTRNLTYDDQLRCFFSLCQQHTELNRLFTLYQYTYLALQRYNQNFFDQTHAPSPSDLGAMSNDSLLRRILIDRVVEAPRSEGLGGALGTSCFSAIPTSGLSAGLSTSSGLCAITSAPPFSAASSSISGLSALVASIPVPSTSRSRKRKQHKCSYCIYTTDSKSNLQDHMNTHGNKKPHKCLDCGRGFNAQSNLCRHRKICSNKKKYHKNTDQ